MTQTNGSFEYVRHVDQAGLAAAGPAQRFSQPLLDHGSGAQNCTISYIQTPAGGGSPAGMHVHEVDQIFFIVSGTMSLEIEGRAMSAGPGSLVVFPTGVPHRNWNDGPEPTIHIAFNTPLPDPDKQFAVPVEATKGGG